MEYVVDEFAVPVVEELHVFVGFCESLFDLFDSVGDACFGGLPVGDER